MNEPLIARVWNGRTASAEAADAYQAIFLDQVLPVLRDVPGFRFAHLLRRETADGYRLTAITFFESMEAVRGFAGDDPDRAHVSAAARAVLIDFDDHVVHFTAMSTADFKAPDD